MKVGLAAGVRFLLSRWIVGVNQTATLLGLM